MCCPGRIGRRCPDTGGWTVEWTGFLCGRESIERRWCIYCGLCRIRSRWDFKELVEFEMYLDGSIYGKFLVIFSF